MSEKHYPCAGGEFDRIVFDGDGSVWVRERTCHIVKASRKYVLSDGTELFEDGCSECNGYLGDDDNYCPNCGAKVVDDGGQ